MQIVVLKDNKHKSSYATSVYTLLEDIGRSKGFKIQFAESIKKAAVLQENSITFITVPSTPSVYKIFQQQRLKYFIKKNNTSLLIQPVVSYIKQKKIPQLLIADNIEKLPAVKRISYSKIFLLTYSLFAKQAIADKGFANIVHVVPFFAGAVFQPITWSMKQQVKIDYTEGREYFLVPNHFTSIETLLKLLKAFSGFKKWQQSSMKLVITGKLYVPMDDWEEKWNTYKYREDVVVFNNSSEEEKVKLLAGAYACIHLPQNDNDLLPLLQAMQCHTPLIAFETASIKEYAAGAVLTTAANDYEALSQQMILMYKDENLRNKLIESCALHAAALSKEKAMQALQTIIL